MIKFEELSNCPICSAESSFHVYGGAKYFFHPHHFDSKFDGLNINWIIIKNGDTRGTIFQNTNIMKLSVGPSLIYISEIPISLTKVEDLIYLRDNLNWWRFLS